MFRRLSYNLSALFPHSLSRQVKGLYESVAIMDLALAMVMIFEPIYLLSVGLDLSHILLFYLSVYVLYFICIPFGARFAKRYGYEKSIMMSSPFLIGLYLSFFAVAHDNLAWLAAAAVCYAMQKTFYWPGYHADFARFSEQSEESREISNLVALSSIVYIIGPFLSGIIITMLGFKTLFVIVSVLILVSNIPLYMVPERFTPAPFQYFESYKRLFTKEYRRASLASFGYAEEFVVLVVWPIFVYLTVKSFFNVGVVVTAATFVTLLVTLYIGKQTDAAKDKHNILKSGSVLYAFVWFLRFLAQSPIGVFFVDTLSRVTKNIVSVPFVSITYEEARSTSVMNRVMVFEMALIIGKIIAILTCLLLWHVTGSYIPLFVFAGLAALLYGVL